MDNENIIIGKQNENNEVVNNNEQVNFINIVKEDFNEIEKSSLNLLLELHENNNISRKNVFDVQNNIKKFLLKPISELIQKVLKNSVDKNLVNKSKIMQIMNRIGGIFDSFDSEYKLKNYLLENKLAENLTVCSFNHELNQTYNEPQDVQKKAEGILLPIKFQITSLFEKENFLMESLDFIKNSECDPDVNNFTKGKLWKEKKEMYTDKLIIPYFIYTDDFCVNNPLGSKNRNQSICIVYYSFPTFATKSSQLDNVFLAYIVKSNDIKQNSYDECFEELIDVIYDLEVNGLNLKTKEGDKKVYFILGGIMGDNLALNSILGFSKSFACNMYCRFCKVSKEECSTLCYELPHTLRNPENYSSDILKNDITQTGIQEFSKFNNIPSFHVTKNYCVDIMHDIFEGVCHYDLAEALHYFIKKMKYFDLKFLNQRCQNFNYGSIESKYKPGEIKMSDISKQKFKLSARQMMTFCYIFPLLVGDMIPDDDPVFKFILLLFEIIDTLLCFNITETLINEARIKIQNHNLLYIQLFKKTLKPKFHLMTHYPSAMQMLGPLRLLWNFKFEAKHKEFKSYTHAITSRKNIPLSMARKYQLKFANYILNLHGCEKTIYNNKITSANIQKFIYQYFPTNENFLTNNYDVYQNVKIYGYIYQIGMYVAVHDTVLKLYKIVYIVEAYNKEPFIICERITNLQYNPHYLSYKIESDSNISNEYNIFRINEFIGPAVNSINTIFGQEFVRLKEYYKLF